jgi:hypothetical protein
MIGGIHVLSILTAWPNSCNSLFLTLFTKCLTPISIKIHFEFLPLLLPLITSLKCHIPRLDFAFATLC